jgi:hypothetical protein
LKLQTEVLDADHENSISLVCGRKNVVDENGKILFSRGYSRRRMQVKGTVAINKNVRSGGNIIGEVGVVMFRKEILNKTGLFDATIYYAIDLDLWYRMLKFGDLYVLPEVVCIFRVSSASESPKIINQQRKDLHDFIKKVDGIREYKLSRYSYVIGMLAVVIMTMAKKIMYRFLVKN